MKHAPDIDENDNNGQRQGMKTEGGERKTGRKSQYKNDRLEGDQYSTMYTTPEKEI